MADHKTDDLSLAKRNFLSRRIAAGDQLTQARADHYIKAHEKVLKDFEDSGPYFRAIAKHVDSPGSRQQPPKPAAEQPSQILAGRGNGASRRFAKPGYDGAARTMPAKVSTGRDQFQSLRDQSKPRAYGRKT